VPNGMATHKQIVGAALELMDADEHQFCPNSCSAILDDWYSAE
jgi:hypothetical protein